MFSPLIRKPVRIFVRKAIRDIGAQHEVHPHSRVRLNRVQLKQGKQKNAQQHSLPFMQQSEQSDDHSFSKFQTFENSISLF